MASGRVNWRNVRMLSGELGEVDLQQLDELTDADGEEGLIKLSVKAAFPTNGVPERVFEAADSVNLTLQRFLTELTQLGQLMVDELAHLNRDPKGRVMTDEVKAEMAAEQKRADEAREQQAMDERVARESTHRPEHR